MSNNNYTVHLHPKGNSIEIDGETDLLTALREEGVYIKSSCGGYASCSDCLVKILEGEDNINSPSFEETQMIGNVFHITKERLACQVKVEGEVKVDLSRHDESADAKKLTKKNNRFNKSKAPVKKRSRAEVDEILSERKMKSEEKEKKRNSWEKHWEKEKDGIKRGTGGGKRPKPFRTDHLDDDPDFKKKS
ncbi:MAG: hypothetical protein CME63_11740 [Halobacteriovoraceae bacterium]|nr:hypothetical protein [Halobacteriovoraceae bacterium]|tara:strand:+ start:74276 stop:74848 length:573 start_codon:yes stop_codon:yes gene_type:complete